MRIRVAASALVLVVAGRCPAGEVKTWRQDAPDDFKKGQAERVVISDAGRIRLMQGMRPTGGPDADHVWDLARDRSGAVFAATGDTGKVYRRDGQGSWGVAFDADDTQALSLVATPDGHLFVGTGPSGQVIDVKGPDHPASRPDESVEYIWDLAADTEGNLYAATGPAGGLWKRPAGGGDWVQVLDSPHPHLLCVAIGPDGTLYAGSDGEGLIYKVTPDGRTSVLYDAPQSEVRALVVGPDEALYAGTAQAASSGGSRRATAVGKAPDEIARGSSSSGTRDRNEAATDAVVLDEAVVVTATQDTPTTGGTARPKPPEAGENAVYRIGADGAALEIFRAKVLIFALTWQGDRLLVGAGPTGQLYEVREGGRESAPIARVDSDQILTMLADGPEGAVLIGTGDPGAVLALEPTYATSGTLASEVLDTKLVSRFGALSWSAEQPKGTHVSVQVRTGNVGEPDDTWSGWSAPQANPDTAKADVPPGRFAQYRLTLETDDPKSTPKVRSLALRYQTVNLAPELEEITVPDLSQADGATRQTELTLEWDASDPNGDDLAYTLAVRKDGWPDWVRLGGPEPLTDNEYKWDTTAVPAGVYRVRVIATDRPANPPREALERALVSEPFLVDHEAPRVMVTPKGRGATIVLKDNLTRLVSAASALDGGDWAPIFPDDGLFDRPDETITLTLPDLKPGTHILMIRATDAAGNSGASDAVFKVE